MVRVWLPIIKKRKDKSEIKYTPLPPRKVKKRKKTGGGIDLSIDVVLPPSKPVIEPVLIEKPKRRRRSSSSTQIKVPSKVPVKVVLPNNDLMNKKIILIRQNRLKKKKFNRFHPGFKNIKIFKNKIDIKLPRKLLYLSYIPSKNGNINLNKSPLLLESCIDLLANRLDKTKYYTGRIIPVGFSEKYSTKHFHKGYYKINRHKFNLNYTKYGGNNAYEITLIEKDRFLFDTKGEKIRNIKLKRKSPTRKKVKKSKVIKKKRKTIKHKTTKTTRVKRRK